MRTASRNPGTDSLKLPKLLSMTAAGVLFLWLAPATRAQSVDFSPEALGKQRATLILKANHTPIADLENDVNHLAVLSETCRAESGAKACGLSDKGLDSNTLEDRYAYYVRKPMEAHTSGKQAKIDRHNWQASAPATQTAAK
jgi:hypothetical protein